MLAFLRPLASRQILRRFSAEPFELISQNDYERVAEETLEHLYDYLDQLPDRIQTESEYDVSYSMGVLTAKVSNAVGTYVINKQSPNRQIWLSSPFSGPKRYDFMENKWIYRHDGSPNRQIWLSSPFSGPKRYDFMENKWIYRHDGISMHSLLQKEFENIFGKGKVKIIDLEKDLKL
uniref:Ferroxidase n=1 Tax=Panagrolaimus sp. JU765 TaxID=591449 RepID=A0AC34RCM9_9BILA